MSFKDLIDFCSADALANSMEPTEDAVWKSICREYSTKFHTPLHLVLNALDPELVISQVYASRLENVDHEENLDSILDSIYTMEDPTYSKDKAAEQQAFDEQAEKDENERLERGESLFKHLISRSTKNNATKMKQILKKKTPKPKPMPKQGGIDMDKLAHLAAEEEEGGFKDE
jgi:hypothetical protein